VPGSGFLAPVVLTEKCVGCGLCQMRCQGINVKEKHLLARSAICLVAGEEFEDRIFSGSYVKLKQMRQDTDRKRTSQPSEGNDYLPDFLQ
jgi:Fe-S-cluster-containing dehydrogenase component